MSNLADAPDARLVEAEDSAGSPITLITGLPGAGKSLLALAEYAVGKPKVFQRGIPGCSLPEWDPEKWSELEPGSTLIIDEAREVYPPQSPTREPPEHYKLHRIRHTGIRLVILAQHPNDIDSRVRRLCGRHLHLVEVFGLEEAVVHEWREVRDPDPAARAESVSRRWKYPREVYKLYKSSTQHRRAASVPWRVRMIPWLWVAAGVCALAGPAWLWYMFKPASEAPAGAGARSAVAGRGLVAPASSDRRTLTPAEWFAERQPRVLGLAHTAPVFDEVTRPVEAPFPAACVAMAARCSCYSQQATALDVPDELCRSIVARGYFVEWRTADARPGGVKPTDKRPGAASDQAEKPRGR